MLKKKHETLPPRQRDVHDQTAAHYYLQRWDLARLAGSYFRLMKESMGQEPKYFDEPESDTGDT